MNQLKARFLFSVIEMYIRFVVTHINEDSHQSQGLFVTSYKLLRAGLLSSEEESELQKLLDWFEENLPIVRHPYVNGRAIFWYHDGAPECIKRMWELANIWQSHNYAIEVQKCRHLHNIQYCDKYQVAAYPHQNDGPIVRK